MEASPNIGIFWILGRRYRYRFLDFIKITLFTVHMSVLVRKLPVATAGFGHKRAFDCDVLKEASSFP